LFSQEYGGRIMTIGEKIREARKSAGLTQEQIAEKLMVSRQAITKWEADKGIPDVENLKSLASLLNVSLDYLLDNGQEMNKSVIRETIDLSKYKKNKKTNIVMEKYPDAEIWALIHRQKLTKSETAIDWVIAIVFNGPFGSPDLINAFKNVDKSYYLVNQDRKQFFVVVTDEMIESREMIKPLTGKKFEIGNMKFTKCGYQVKNKKS
jgi:transcriptional regulator with XRE-family HTH domain